MIKRLKNLKRKYYIIVGVSLAVLFLLFCFYSRFISPTYVGLVRFRDFQYAKFLKAKQNAFIKIKRIEMTKDKIPNLSKYKIIYIWAHGMNMNLSMKKELEKAIKKGVNVYMYAATNAETNISNITGKDMEYVSGYFKNGGTKNYKRLFNYSRRVFDKKKLFSNKVESPYKISRDTFFYLGEEDYFNNYSEYQKFYIEKGHYKEGRPKVCIFMGNVGPRNSTRVHIDLFIKELENRNLNVYPIDGFFKRFDFLKQVQPDLAVIMPHGRFARGRGGELIAYLKKHNIPLLCPINIFSPYKEWLKSQQGMVGGIMSQSITVPELDGGIEPFVISALFKNKQGLYVFDAIPNRIRRFCDKIVNWLTLKNKQNKDKKLAIYYYKGPGLNSMIAGGLEVAPSLLNLLKALKSNGFHTGKLPDTEKEFMQIIQKQGPVLGAYAKGSFEDYLKNGKPALIPVESYKKWALNDLPPDLYEEVEKLYGPAPGDYMSVTKDDINYIAVTRIQFGNIVILPQPLPAYGDDESKLIHGAKQAPTHPYIASYLWVRNEFRADALMHFGTHGSLEFTPWKQIALSDYDWPDILVGEMPHIYIYTISNIGEAMIAKRRSYAVITSHITPPFTEAELYGSFKQLHDKVHDYYYAKDEALKIEYVKSIKTLILKMKLQKDLSMKELDKKELTHEMITKLHNYIHSIEQAKINRGLYTLGIPYTKSQIRETTRLMAIDPISYSLAKLDIIRRVEKESIFNNSHEFGLKYRDKTSFIINNILEGRSEPLSFIDKNDIKRLKKWEKENKQISDRELMARMMKLASNKDSKKPIDKKLGKDKQDILIHRLKEKEKEYVMTVKNLQDALQSIKKNYNAIKISYQEEINAVITALSGGYIAPSSGGDPVRNPNSVPTGRNLFAIDAERTPTKEAWKVGKQLADSLIETKLKNTGEYPKKVAFTLWGGEFIRAQGINIAEIFYLLGVEPVWNSTGRVHDVKLVPIEKLNRPRIDVVVQTSGQFRDIAASRIYLINKAVKLASTAKETKEFKNYVKQGTLLAEKIMKEKGISPKKARMFSVARVFGGVNGNYGTGIMGLVESGDKWEEDKEITDRYLNNMGAVYTKENWGAFEPGVFEGALQNTDTIVQPRSSNLYGPLTLDHVYEFMGGLNAVIRNVTGRDPDAYFNDIRNKQQPIVQDLKEAIWTETRTKLYNPKYIKDLQKGGASSAEEFAEAFRNTYGWNVMKPKAIDKELWDGLYDVYINDKYKLDMQNYFKKKNPYALQEMTAVMLETIRKGYWKPDDKIIKNLANLHALLVKDHKAGCSGFVCDNLKLQEMIKNNIDDILKEDYQKQIDSARIGEGRENKKGMKLKREKITLQKMKSMIQENITAILTMLIIIILFTGAVIYGVVRKRKT